MMHRCEAPRVWSAIEPQTCSRKSSATASAAHSEKLRTAGIVEKPPSPNATTSVLSQAHLS